MKRAGEGGGAILEAGGAGVHGEDDVEVLDDLAGEPFVQLLARVQHESVALGAFLDLSHEGGVLVALEETGDLSVGEKRVDALEEARVEDVALVHDEADLLSLAAGAAQDDSEVLVEVFHGVLGVDLELEDGEAVHPGHEATEGRLSGPGHADKEEMALRLPVDAVDAEDVVEDFVEEDEGDVEFLLVEDLETGLDVAAQLFLVDGHVVLGEPAAVEDGASERGLEVEAGEVLGGGGVHEFVGPLALGVGDESVLEESQGFVGPEPDESFGGQSLERSDSFADAANPASHLPRAVDVVGLHVLSEAFLGGEIEVHHGAGQRVGVGA